MFEILFLIIVAAYFVQASLLSIGSKKKFSKIDVDELPTASIIVAARNEQDNIKKCLDSLAKLDYPENKLEVILVDDDSSDKTYSIIQDFIIGKPSFTLIKAEKDFGDTKGKARAIANAIEIAKGEIILTTDADCTVSRMWAATIAGYYKDEVVMVCGYTDQRGKSLFDKVQDMDFIYLLTIGGGSINLGKPLSAIGNNMSYRKSAYHSVGGYENIPFSVTEDFQLLMAINKLEGKKIIFPADPGSLVTSEPCKNWKTLFQQKRRWAIGGLKSTIGNLLIISTGFWVPFLIWFVPFFYSPTVLYLLLLKIFTDLFLVYFMYKRLQLKFNIMYFISFQIYQTLYFTLVGISLLFSKKVIWKGREF